MMRYAIYFTPPQDHPLTRLAADWLGRDAFGAEPMPARPSGTLSAADVAFHTAPARRYGFHATMKAPFRLRDGVGVAQLERAVAEFARRREAFTVPAMALRRLGGFFALVPAQRNAALDDLAGEIVTEFEPFRAALGEAEIARRNPDGLTPVQLRHLHRWGYPYVFDEFRFHMTLTGRVPEEDAPRVEAAIRAHFGAAVDAPLEIGSIAVFVEESAGEPFHVQSFHEFQAVQERKSA